MWFECKPQATPKPDHGWRGGYPKPLPKGKPPSTSGVGVGGAGIYESERAIHSGRSDSGRNLRVGMGNTHRPIRLGPESTSRGGQSIPADPTRAGIYESEFAIHSCRSDPGRNLRVGTGPTDSVDFRIFPRIFQFLSYDHRGDPMVAGRK